MCDSGCATVDETRLNELAALDSLRMALETGWCRSLRNKLKLFGPRLVASKDADILAQYDHVLKEANDAFRIEAAHGQGCLLRLDHVLMKDIIGIDKPRDPPLVSKEEIEAARRYAQANA